ncbi:MAG: hypothetical protein ACKERG_02795 [Candidatus Hodgkinia cicadicola]
MRGGCELSRPFEPASGRPQANCVTEVRCESMGVGERVHRRGDY